MSRRDEGNEAERRRVLTKAVIAAADALGITSTELGEVLCLSAAAVNQLRSGDYLLVPGDTEWEHAVLLVRIFRSLDSLVGGSPDESRKWLRSQNSALFGKPLELVATAEGLSRVASYLDACRRGL